MKIFKISSIFWTFLFIVGALFLWFRTTDGSGAVNSLGNQLASLAVWLFLFIIILIVHLIWHHNLTKKM